MQRTSIPFAFLFFLFCSSLFGQGLTYFGDIQPILAENCANCHRKDEIGPMPLTTYDEVSAYGSMIKYVTTSKLMPPWYADTGYSHFGNERRLSETEIKALTTWIESGMPKGDSLKSTQTIPANKNNSRKPDLTVSMAQSFEQYGIYVDQYQVFVLPTHLKEDTWVEGVEFVPGNKKIVRFAAISVETSNRFDSLDRWDPRYGFYSFGGAGQSSEFPFWYTWTLEQSPTFYPVTSARLLPKNAKLIVYIQYGPIGQPQSDSSSVNLYFAKKKPQHEVQTRAWINPSTLTADSFFIPANTKKSFHASYTLSDDIDLFGLTPQANLLCRSWEVFARLPNQSTIKLLKIPEWNFNWKDTYHFDKSIHLPKGSVIHALAQYDNTLENPCNPSEKPVDFHEGYGLFNELFFVHFEFMK